MRTSYRDIFLLACCQALLLVNNASLIAMNGLVGYALAGDKAFAARKEGEVSIYSSLIPTTISFAFRTAAVFIG